MTYKILIELSEQMGIEGGNEWPLLPYIDKLTQDLRTSNQTAL